MKNFPASPKSAFFWRNWEPRCEWPQASKAQALVRDAISLVDAKPTNTTRFLRRKAPWLADTLSSVVGLARSAARS